MQKDIISRAKDVLLPYTPLSADCGLVCGKACCKGDKETGMLLFPGEDTAFPVKEIECWYYEYDGHPTKEIIEKLVPIMSVSGYEERGREELIKAYENYMSNEKWVAFLKEMNKEHRIAYVQGYGNEISEKRGRYGIYPPKMASYGSSSRMIYNLLKKVEGIHFEKKLPTKVGGTANLDGYLQRGETEIFIEAKCREIYTKHANIDIKEVYDKVLKAIKNENAFHYKEDKETKTGYLNYRFFYGKTPIVRFDIKQLICHFLGIAANYIKNKSAKNKICFIYLIYNPTDFNIRKLTNCQSPTDYLYMNLLMLILGVFSNG